MHRLTPALSILPGSNTSEPYNVRGGRLISVLLVMGVATEIFLRARIRRVRGLVYLRELERCARESDNYC